MHKNLILLSMLGSHALLSGVCIRGSDVYLFQVKQCEESKRLILGNAYAGLKFSQGVYEIFNTKMAVLEMIPLKVKELCNEYGVINDGVKGLALSMALARQFMEKGREDFVSAYNWIIEALGDPRLKAIHVVQLIAGTIKLADAVFLEVLQDRLDKVMEELKAVENEQDVWQKRLGWQKELLNLNGAVEKELVERRKIEVSLEVANLLLLGETKCNILRAQKQVKDWQVRDTALMLHQLARTAAMAMGLSVEELDLKKEESIEKNGLAKTYKYHELINLAMQILKEAKSKMKIEVVETQVSTQTVLSLIEKVVRQKIEELSADISTKNVQGRQINARILKLIGFIKSADGSVKRLRKKRELMADEAIYVVSRFDLERYAKTQRAVRLATQACLDVPDLKKLQSISNVQMPLKEIDNLTRMAEEQLKQQDKELKRVMISSFNLLGEVCLKLLHANAEQFDVNVRYRVMLSSAVILNYLVQEAAKIANQSVGQLKEEYFQIRLLPHATMLQKVVRVNRLVGLSSQAMSILKVANDNHK